VKEAKDHHVLQSFDRGEFFPKVRDWALQEFGQEPYNQLSKTLPSEIAHLLEHADPAAWYPVEYTRITYEGIASYFGEDQLESFVRFYVDKAIHGFIRGLVAFLRPLDLAKRALALWRRFHSTGRPEIEVLSKTHGTITLYDWDYSRIHCKVHALWFAELIRAAGGKNVEVKETHCVHSGDGFCRWGITFS
jgi:hypothetical protein